MVAPYKRGDATTRDESSQTGNKGIRGKITDQFKMNSLDSKRHKDVNVGFNDSRLTHMTVLDQHGPSIVNTNLVEHRTWCYTLNNIGN